MKKILALLLCVVMVGLLACSCSKPDPSPETPAPDQMENGLTRAEILAEMDNDFRSRTLATYPNINGKDVSVYGFYVYSYEPGNNPNFSQAVLIDQCTKYKQAHPDEKVTLTFSSFYLSVYTAACINRESPEYGRMKNLSDVEYTADGYYRISYLLLEAARNGVEVTIVARRNVDVDHNEYFSARLAESTYIEGKTIGDFMTYRKSFWTAYDDRAATDMMHNKILAVSNYMDYDGNEHGPAVWTGSINVDGINEDGSNGNTGAQSAVIVAEHDEIFRIAQNYIRLMVDYCAQEDALVFRELIRSMNTEQIALINAGKNGEIPKDRQIVYLGTENDPVFELYFSSFGGNANTWDTVNNPFCKYLSKLAPSVSGGNYIDCIWVNPKYDQDYGWGDAAMKLIADAFAKNPNTKNVLNLSLPGVNADTFTGLTEGENIGVFSINEIDYAYHNKDLQISYVENGMRHYVTLYNSMNMHAGSMYYQTNTLLVVHETDATGNYNYLTYRALFTPHINFQNERVKENT